MTEPGYPLKCTKCGKAFNPGDKFYYDMLGDDEGLDDRCEECAGSISMMASETIPSDSTEQIRR